MVVGFFYSLALVWWIMPNVIFSKGGYGAFNVGLVGRLYGIPLVVHDSDSAPGLVSRLLGKIATRVAISFPAASEFFAPYKTALVGNPIRASVVNGSKEKATAQFGLKGDRPLIVVLGGSQGSVRINEVIGASLKELLATYEVLHQVGSVNEEAFGREVKEIYGIDPKADGYYHVKGFLSEEENANALAAADIIISRAGSGSIYEIAAAGKPSILIPLSDAAYDHQRLNAFAYAHSGASLVIEEANMSPHILGEGIKNIMQSKNRQNDMAAAAKAFAKPDAAQKIAQGILELV
jgi:UDP-N-acetylglucosamine--N-acetylmuramyl-(pentapeptide) pyrophosphoryl-undecaprenol N-acetylglucosamine transferase